MAYSWEPSDFVIAVDPGLVTGYSTWSAEKGFLADSSGQMDWIDFEHWLWEQGRLIHEAGKTLWVQWEKFSITARTVRTAVQYESLYVNGMILFMCKHFGFEQGSSQPEQVMRIFSDTALKALGWYLDGLGHQHDSARHLGLVLLQRGVITSKDMAKGVPRGPKGPKKIK